MAIAIVTWAALTGVQVRHTDDFIMTNLRKLLFTSVLSVLNKDNPCNDKVKYERTWNFKIYSYNKDENPESSPERNKMVIGIVVS